MIIIGCVISNIDQIIQGTNFYFYWNIYLGKGNFYLFYQKVYKHEMDYASGRHMRTTKKDEVNLSENLDFGDVH